MRNLWVYLVGAVTTLFYAGRVVLYALVRHPKLPCRCEEAPRVWAHLILRSAGVAVEVQGTGNLGEGAQILISNHQSWFDVFSLAAHLPVRYHFVAKKELAKIPVFGRAWIACGHIAIDRQDRTSAVHSLAEAAEKIRGENTTIIMFPEGTRSLDGELQRFKKGAFVLAIQAQVPIIPIAIIGSGEIMPKGKWSISPGVVLIRIGEPIPVAGLTLDDRDRLLQVARRSVAALKEGRPVPPAPWVTGPPVVADERSVEDSGPGGNGRGGEGP